MEATTASHPPAEGVSPRKHRKAQRKQREIEEPEISGTENRLPPPEQSPDLKSDSPNDRSAGDHHVAAYQESRPTPSRPSSRNTSRSKYSASDPQRAKINALVSRAFANNAPELLEALEDADAFFPRVVPDGIDPGIKYMPRSDYLQSILHRGDGTEPTGNQNDEVVRDTVFAGTLVGSPEILEACLKYGADLGVSDVNGRNIFHYLAATGDAPLLRKVLRRIEKTHGRPEERKGTAGSRPPTPNETPSEALSFNQLINQVDHRGWTPILMAIARSNEEAVEGLLLYPQVTLDTQLAHTCPPSRGLEPAQSGALHLAAMRCHAGITKRLLNTGASMTVTDNLKRTLFHYAAAHWDHEAAVVYFDVLSKGDKFDARTLLEVDRHERSPIFVAVAWGNLQLAEKMIQQLKAPQPRADEDTEESSFSLNDVLLKPDVWGLTCLHVAQLRRHHSVLFRVAKLWATYKTANDPETVVDALRNASATDLGQITSLPRAVKQLTADKRNLAKWLEVDFTPLERATYSALKGSLLEPRPNMGSSEAQLARAVRRVGTEVCLRVYTKVMETEKSHTALTSRGATRRLGPEASFYRVLREVVFAESAPSDARAAMIYVLGENYTKAAVAGGPSPVSRNTAPVGCPTTTSSQPAGSTTGKRGAEKLPPHRSGSGVGRFAAPLTGASPRAPPFQSVPKGTPDRSGAERRTPFPPRSSPPHNFGPPHNSGASSTAINTSRMNRSVGAAGGSPGFMSATKSSTLLLRNTTGPRPPTKGSLSSWKAVPPTVRQTQPKAVVHRPTPKRQTGPPSSTGNLSQPIPTPPSEFSRPAASSEASFESHSEARSIVAA